MSKYEDKIKEIATDTKLNDSEFTTKAIGEELVDANVKIKDEAFSNILTNFIDAAETKTSSDSDAKESTTKESETNASTEESK
jgi:foldase protein PrsA